MIAFALAQIGYSWFYASTIAFSVRQDLHIQAFLWLMEKVLFAAAGVAVHRWQAGGFVAVAFSNTFVQFFGGAPRGLDRLAQIRAVHVQARRGPLGGLPQVGPSLRADRRLLPGLFPHRQRHDLVLPRRRGGRPVRRRLQSGLGAAVPACRPGGARMFPGWPERTARPDDNLDGPFQRAARWLLAMSLPMAVGVWLLAEHCC